jgi:hypothetical protein
MLCSRPFDRVLPRRARIRVVSLEVFEGGGINRGVFFALFTCVLASGVWHLDKKIKKKLLKKFDEEKRRTCSSSTQKIHYRSLGRLFFQRERKTEERQRTLLHRGVEIRKNIGRRRKVSSHDEDYDQRRGVEKHRG